MGNSDNDIKFQVYKVIVIGDPAVGKTDLLTNFCGDKFEYEYPPSVGVNITKEPVTIKDDMGKDITVYLMLWDIAGQPQFYMLHRPYFNDADGMMLVYDITRSSSFSNINNWFSTAVKYGLSGIPKILVGIKKDKNSEQERKIILPMAQHVSEKLNAPYFEVSLETGENVQLIFQTIAELIYRDKNGEKWYETPPVPKPPNIIQKKDLSMAKIPEPADKKGSKEKEGPKKIYKKFRKIKKSRDKKEKVKKHRKRTEAQKEFSAYFQEAKLKKEEKYQNKKVEKELERKKPDVSGEYDYLLKTIVVGDGGVGKTALTLRFSKGFFTEDYKMTIGVDFHVKTIAIDSFEDPIRAKLQIWDTGGQERFSSIRPMYYRGSSGALLIFDLNNSASFVHLPQWIEEVRANVKTEIPLLLVGNKSDLFDQRVVSLEEINNFRRNFNLHYVETSAKTGEGVGDCFYILACLMIGLGAPDPPFPIVPPDDPGSAGGAGITLSDEMISALEQNIVHEKYCQYCGAQMTVDEDFCNVCGKKRPLP